MPETLFANFGLFVGKKEKEIKKQQTPAISQKNKAQGKLCDCLNVLLPRSIMAGLDIRIVKWS